ncbi:hypothetical protein ACTFIR_004143 [Dictyostelium discoideum]
MEYEKFMNENKEILIGIDQDKIYQILKKFTPNQLEETNIKEAALEFIKLNQKSEDSNEKIENLNIENGNLKQKLEDSTEEKENLNIENGNLKQTLVDSTLNKNKSLKSPATHAELFDYIAKNGLVKKDCDFKSWGIPNNIKVNSKINFEKLNETEKDIQIELDKFFKKFNEKRRIIVENGTKINIKGFSSNNYCDYIIKEIGFPNAPFWIHMIGDVKKGSITTKENYGQIFKYMSNIFEKSNHCLKERPMFGFLINNQEINFTKYDTSENKYYITKNYKINEGIQLLSDLLYSLENEITEIPSSLNKILKKCTSGDVEFFYGATSSVFIVNDNLVFKWFNNSSDFKHEAYYLSLLKGIKGTPSIVQKNEKENWIEISPRGRLVWDLKDKALPISFFTESVEILQKIHKRFIIHRDIRLSNLLKMDNGSPLLVDFGFATNTRNDVKYCGTLTTASNIIYEKLIDKGFNDTFSVTEADDLESLVKIFVMENEDCVKGIIDSIKSKEVMLLKTNWDWLIKKQDNYSKLFQLASNKNYEELKNEFLILDEHKSKNQIDFNTNEGSNITSKHASTLSNISNTSKTKIKSSSQTETISEETTGDYYIIKIDSSFVKANLIDKSGLKRLERAMLIFQLDGQKELSIDLVDIEKNGILYMEESQLKL